MKPRDALEPFSLRPVAQGGLFGAFLASCAIEGALDVLHAGVGCKGKTQRQLVDHDWGQETHARVGWTELSEAEWIRDAAEPLVRNGVELFRRRKPELMLVTTSSAVSMTGVDMGTAVEQLARKVPCPVAFVSGAGDAPDLWAGYAAVIRSLFGLIDWREPVGDRHAVSFVGYFFHRHEMDQAANLSELRRLLDALGATMGPVLLGGERWSSLQGVHRSGLLLRLPFAGMSAKEMAAVSGRKVLDCALPMGLAATSRWLRAMGRRLTLAPERVSRLVEQEEKKTRTRIEMARRVLSGHRLAVLADTPAAAAWCGLGLELGMEPVLVALLDRSLGGEAAFEKLLRASGHQRPRNLRLLAFPSMRRLRACLLEEGPRPEIVVRPDLSLAGSPWESLPAVESGYPARHRHAVYPCPDLGYSGVAAQAQRLLDAWMWCH